MKVLFFTIQLSTIGGIERTLIDKANYMATNGHDVFVVTVEQGTLPYSYVIDKKVHLIDLGIFYYHRFRLPIYKRLGFCLHARERFRVSFSEVLERVNPDISVITTPNTESFLYDAISLSKVFNAKVIIESHLFFNYHFVPNGFFERIIQLMYSPMKGLRQADLLITLTEGDKSCWIKHGIQNATVVPNPLPFSPQNLDKRQAQEGRILYVGRLDKQKRVDRLIDAFALLADKYPVWTIDIFGEGTCQTQLEKQVKHLKLADRIRFHGPTNCVIEEYQQSQFFVLCSDYEGFGLVLIEAMACGIPVVSTDCPFGPSDIIEDGLTGLLARMDVQDLAAKMEWMITHEAERNMMGVRGRYAAAKYEKEEVMKEWERAYMSVLK